MSQVSEVKQNFNDDVKRDPSSAEDTLDYVYIEGDLRRQIYEEQYFDEKTYKRYLRHLRSINRVKPRNIPINRPSNESAVDIIRRFALEELDDYFYRELPKRYTHNVNDADYLHKNYYSSIPGYKVDEKYELPPPPIVSHSTDEEKRRELLNRVERFKKEQEDYETNIKEYVGNNKPQPPQPKSQEQRAQEHKEFLERIEKDTNEHKRLVKEDDFKEFVIGKAKELIPYSEENWHEKRIKKHRELINDPRTREEFEKISEEVVPIVRVNNEFKVEVTTSCAYSR